MVDVIGRAKVIIEGDVDTASIDSAGGKIGSTLKRGAVVGVAALGTLTVGAVKAYQAFEEAEAVSRKLSTVLGNMGESAAVEGVEKLADSLMRLTGVDDEVIKKGQTILATFSEVAESAGNVGGVFERATKASLDLSAAGFGSVESASVMLGKALQDPEKGITALSRAGVTFTESQKQLIQGFIDAGDAASAQAIILEEVEKQVQGTAEANATESAKIAAAWGEVQEAIGGALSTLTGGEVTSMSEALNEMADAINDLAESEGWEKFGEVIRDMNADVKDNDTFLGDWAQQSKDTGNSLIDLADEAGNTAERIKDAWDGIPALFDGWGSDIKSSLEDLGDKFKDVADRIRDAWEGIPALFSDAADVPDAPDVSQPRSTRAVGGPTSGLTLVGERGPELLSVPNGSYVYNNNDTKDMLSGSTTNVFNIATVGPVGPSLLQELNWWGKFAQPEAVTVNG